MGDLVVIRRLVIKGSRECGGEGTRRKGARGKKGTSSVRWEERGLGTRELCLLAFKKIRENTPTTVLEKEG